MHPDRFAALSRSLGDSTSRRGLLRLLGVGVAGTAITAVGLTEAQAERKKAKQARSKKVRAQATAADLIENVTGTVTGTGALVTGTFKLEKFVARGGQLLAIGTFRGTAGDATGTQQLTLPVTNILVQGECEILHLELGPIDLNLLGLEVHIDQIVIDITADPAGGLLGQLLCAIANLLNGGGLLNQLNQLVSLLNRLLRLLQ